MKHALSFVTLAAALSLLTASSCNFCCNKKAEPVVESTQVEEQLSNDGAGQEESTNELAEDLATEMVADNTEAMAAEEVIVS